MGVAAARTVSGTRYQVLVVLAEVSPEQMKVSTEPHGNATSPQSTLECANIVYFSHTPRHLCKVWTIAMVHADVFIRMAGKPPREIFRKLDNLVLDFIPPFWCPTESKSPVGTPIRPINTYGHPPMEPANFKSSRIPMETV